MLTRLETQADIDDGITIEIKPFDNQFKDYSEGLRPPYRFDGPDFLPDVSDEDERKLLDDAYTVYVTLKRWDTLHLKHLYANEDSPERRAAWKVEQSINETATRLQLQILEANIGLAGNLHLTDVANKFREADKERVDDESMDARVKRRLDKFQSIQYGIDCDKTITKNADYLPMIPGSVQSENFMAHEDHGRETFPYVFSRYWREAMQIMKDNFKLIGSRVPLREGVEEFFYRTEKNNYPISIISANFRPFIDGVVTNLPAVSNILHTFAVEVDDISATDKSTVIRTQVAELPNHAMIYIGDGLSDLPAMDEYSSQVVCVYFALKNSDFEYALQAAALPYYAYETFHDINQTLERLGVIPAQEEVQ